MNIIDERLRLGNLSDLIGGPTVQTPAGLVVSSRDVDALIKSEARRLAAQEDAKKQPLLFSRHAMFANMQMYGARDKPRETPGFFELREAAKKSFIDAILIQARRDQAKMVWQRAVEGKQVGFRVVHERHDDPTFKPTDNIERRCREMEELLADPTPRKYRHLYPHGNRVHDGLKDLVTRLVYAELVIDRKVLYRYKRRDGKGYAAFHWLPGDTIKPVHEGIKAWTAKNPDPLTGKRDITAKTLDRMSAATGFDIWNSDYVQIDRTGTLIAAFTDDEISLHIANPSDEMDRQGYGVSRLELSLDVTTTVLYAWNYNKEMFKTNYPEQLLAITGSFDKAGLEAWKQQILGEAGGPGNNWRLPVVTSEDGGQFGDKFDIKTFKLREAPKDMLFDQLFRMLVAVKAAAYGAHPSIVNFTVESGGSNSLFGHSPVDEIEFSKEHGFLPGLMDLCSWLTDAVVKPTYDDLKVIIIGLDEASDKEKLDMDIQRVKAYITKNDQRVKDNLEPIGCWVGTKEEYDALSDEDRQKYDDNPWNYPADAPMATYITALGQAKMQAQQLEQMQQQPEDGMDGQDGGQPEDGQDFGGGEDDNPWGADSYGAPDPMQKAIEEPEREVKYLRITIE